jgi:hypothetical protein
MKGNPFRCDYCGRFISYEDLESGQAETYEIFPDSEYSVETWATHHIACKEASESEQKKRAEAAE